MILYSTFSCSSLCMIVCYVVSISCGICSWCRKSGRPSQLKSHPIQPSMPPDAYMQYTKIQCDYELLFILYRVQVQFCKQYSESMLKIISQKIISKSISKTWTKRIQSNPTVTIHFQNNFKYEVTNF